MHLPIRETWDGLPIERAEQADVRVGRSGDDWIVEVEAAFHDDEPPRSPPGSCPRLWTYEVVECFLVGEDERYLEVELGPHGHFLLLSLHGVRNIVRQGMAARYRAEVDRPSGRWRGLITLGESLVPLPLVRANAFALHGRASERRYLCHSSLPGERADFHQIGRFPAFTAPTAAAVAAAAPDD